MYKKFLRDFLTKIEAIVGKNCMLKAGDDSYYIEDHYNEDDLAELFNDRDVDGDLFVSVYEISTSRLILTFNLSSFPACCGIVVSNAANVHPSFTGKGINTIANQFRLELAKILGYGMIIAADIMSNKASIKTLNKNDWKQINTFINPRSGNELGVFIKNL